MQKKTSEDTYSYSGWLNSDKFIKRSFAVLGHYLFAQVAIGVIIGLVVVVWILIGTALGLSMGK